MEGVSGATMTGRIITILDAVASDPDRGWGVRELAAELQESRSTVNRALQGLSEADLISASGQGTYRVGPRLRVLAATMHATHPILRAGHQVVGDLSKETNATVLLAVDAAPVPACLITLVHQKTGPVQYTLKAGDLLPLHAGAAGRAILGEIGIGSLAGPLEAMTPETATDPMRIAELVKEDHQRGYVVSVGHLFTSSAGVASGATIQGLSVALSVTHPRHQVNDAALVNEAKLVQQAVQRLCSLADANDDLHLVAARSYPPGSTAVERIVRLVGLLATHPNGVRDDKQIADRVGATPATATALTSTAKQSGLAITDAQALRPGPLLLKWAAKLSPEAPPSAVADDLLRQLGTDLAETVGLAEYSAETGTAQMTAVIPGARPMDYSLAAGVQIPLHAGAAGKVILAYCDDQVIESQPLTQITSHTHHSKEDLVADLSAIRERGYATGEGERFPDAFGVSAPYFKDGNIAGSITVTIPKWRFHDSELDALASTMKATAARITDRLST